MAVLRLPKLPLVEIAQAPFGLGLKSAVPASGGTPVGITVPSGTTGVIIQAPVDILWSISTSPGSASSTFFTLPSGQSLVLSTLAAVSAFRASSKTGQSVQLSVQFTQGGSGAGTGTDTAEPQVQGGTYLSITSLQSAYQFTVAFTDNVNVAYSTLNVSRVRVSGPANFSKIPTLVGISPAANAKTVTATLSVPGPFGSAENGIYSIAVEAGAIFDTSGIQNNYAIAGTFAVNISEIFVLGAGPNVIGINGSVIQVF